MKDYNTISETNYKGHTIKIFRDEYAEGPNEWLNEDLFLVYDHRDFCVERKGYDPEQIFEHIKTTGRNFYEGYHVFTVYAYIHSGVSLSLGKDSYPFTCKWDTSFRGFILVKREKGWSYTKKKAFEAAQGLIETWNIYLYGDVLGYTVEKDGEVTDSCGGFYDKQENVLSEAKGIIDYQVRQAAKSHFEKLKQWIKSKVPFAYRTTLQTSLGY